MTFKPQYSVVTIELSFRWHQTGNPSKNGNEVCGMTCSGWDLVIAVFCASVEYPLLHYCITFISRMPIYHLQKSIFFLIKKRWVIAFLFTAGRTDFISSDEQEPCRKKWALLLGVHAPCCGAGSGLWLPECWQVWGQSSDSPFTFSVFHTSLSVEWNTTDLWMSDPDGKNLLAKALNFCVNINACVKRGLLLLCSFLFPCSCKKASAELMGLVCSYLVSPWIDLPQEEPLLAQC